MVEKKSSFLVGENQTSMGGTHVGSQSDNSGLEVGGRKCDGVYTCSPG